MKKKTAITVSTLLLLTVGGVTALNVINPSWRENTIFATARDKQLVYLKAHEKEIVAWIHSVYPKVETVLYVSFSLDDADSMPDISRMRMNHPPGIRKNGVLINYE